MGDICVNYEFAISTLVRSLLLMQNKLLMYYSQQSLSHDSVCNWLSERYLHFGLQLFPWRSETKTRKLRSWRQRSHSNQKHPAPLFSSLLCQGLLSDRELSSFFLASRTRCINFSDIRVQGIAYYLVTHDRPDSKVCPVRGSLISP